MPLSFKHHELIFRNSAPHLIYRENITCKDHLTTARKATGRGASGQSYIICNDEIVHRGYMPHRAPFISRIVDVVC